jgi:hypothetical protein
MNDETREQLSAYLDGALTEAERRELESRLAASAELRGALEDLRSVSRAVKDLPKEPLPSGFLVRFQARRARGDAPRADWVFLPPAARPVVAALSVGVVALVIWNKVTVQPDEMLLHPPEAAAVYGSANAPVAQLDLSRQLGAGGAISGAASGGAGGAGGAGNTLSDAKSLEITGAAAAPARGIEKLSYLDKDAGAADELKAGTMAAKKGSSAVAVVRGGSARAAGAPIAQALDAAAPGAAPSAEPQLTDRTRLAMTEEERSARNEELFSQLEGQKKKMGMRVLPKGDNGEDRRAGFLGMREPPAAPALRAPVPTLLQSGKAQGVAAGSVANAAKADAAPGPGRLAPDAGLVFTDASSLSSSWVLLGLPGDPPSADFANGRVVVIKPSATKILSVTPGPDSVTVVFRSLSPDEDSDPARDRVAPLPAAPKTVLIYDASPR